MNSRQFNCQVCCEFKTTWTKTLGCDKPVINYCTVYHPAGERNKPLQLYIAFHVCFSWVSVVSFSCRLQMMESTNVTKTKRRKLISLNEEMWGDICSIGYLREWRTKKEGGKEETRETAGANSQPSFPSERSLDSKLRSTEVSSTSSFCPLLLSMLTFNMV